MRVSRLTSKAGHRKHAIGYLKVRMCNMIYEGKCQQFEHLVQK